MRGDAVKTIGLLGGMSWESTLHYYRIINEGVRDRLGGLHSARILLRSVDFAPIARLQASDRWDEAAALLAEEARGLARGGADLLLLCTNTMHQVAPQVAAAIPIPLVHIGDVTAQAIKARGLRRVGLLATRFTMERAFYRERLEQAHGLSVLVPPPEERERIHRVIYDELCLGRLLESSRADYRRIAAGLLEAGAEAVIFGCTEIGMLLTPADVAAPVFDSTALHAAAAVDLSLQNL
jgi:aspartate racemase